MKRLLLFSLVFICCLPFMYGTQRLVGANWDVAFTEPYPATANDFHVNIDLKSASNKVPTLNQYWSYDHVGPAQGGTEWFMNKITINQDATDPTIWHTFVDFKTTGGVVFNGATVHFGAEFKVEDFNYFRVRMAYWTRDGEFLCPAQLAGFHVWESAALGTIVTLFNDTAAAMSVDQLELAVTPAHIPLQDMFSTGVGLPGELGKYPDIKWKAVNGAIKIDPGKSVDVRLSDVGLEIVPNEFLQFRAYVNGIPQWWQHQQ